MHFQSQALLLIKFSHLFSFLYFYPNVPFLLLEHIQGATINIVLTYLTLVQFPGGFLLLLFGFYDLESIDKCYSHLVYVPVLGFIWYLSYN